MINEKDISGVESFLDILRCECSLSLLTEVIKSTAGCNWSAANFTTFKVTSLLISYVLFYSFFWSAFAVTHTIPSGHC